MQCEYVVEDGENRFTAWFFKVKYTDDTKIRIWCRCILFLSWNIVNNNIIVNLNCKKPPIYLLK